MGWGRSRYEPPVGHTCPDINEAQNISSNAIDQIDASTGAFEDLKKYLNKLIDQLELLRKENSELREWGSEMAEKLEEAEDERDQYERERDDLQDKIKDLENELKQYL